MIKGPILHISLSTLSAYPRAPNEDFVVEARFRKRVRKDANTEAAKSMGHTDPSGTQSSQRDVRPHSQAPNSPKDAVSSPAQNVGDELSASLDDFKIPRTSLPANLSDLSPEKLLARELGLEQTRRYSADDILSISNCLKLATKLVAGKGLLDDRWEGTNRGWIPSFKKGVERGIQLIVNEAPVTHVIAGMIAGPFAFKIARIDTHEGMTLADRDRSKHFIRTAIIEKFGFDVLKSIETRRYLDFCRNDIHQEDASLIGQAQKAFFAAFDLYEGIDRQWGPHENMPLIHHASEVGLLLLAARYPSTTVAAGFLHDAFENYCLTPHDQITEMIHNRLANSFTYGEIETVLRKIHDNTEPAKSAAPENWEQRKGKVFKALHHADSDTTAVCCASKISTLANANKWNYLDQPLSAWSKGTFQQNLEHFRSLGRLFEEKGLRLELLDVFNEQLTRFTGWRNRGED